MKKERSARRDKPTKEAGKEGPPTSNSLTHSFFASSGETPFSWQGRDWFGGGRGESKVMVIRTTKGGGSVFLTQSDNTSEGV